MQRVLWAIGFVPLVLLDGLAQHLGGFKIETFSFAGLLHSISMIGGFMCVVRAMGGKIYWEK